MALREAGLAIMGLSAADREGGCRDPDCVGCRIRCGERPRPNLVAELNTLNARLQRLSAADQNDHPYNIDEGMWIVGRKRIICLAERVNHTSLVLSLIHI